MGKKSALDRALENISSGKTYYIDDDWLSSFEKRPWYEKALLAMAGYVQRFFKEFYYAPQRWLFRIKHGFWPIEWWNFYSELGRRTAPKLKFLRDNSHGVPIKKYVDGQVEPVVYEDDEWRGIMDKIILAFEQMVPGDDVVDTTIEQDNERKAKVEEGLLLFAKHWGKLWD